MSTAVDLDAVEAVVLVEGVSDQRAVETLARQSGRDLSAERVIVLAMGGATNIGRYLGELGPAGRDLRLAGLVDEAEVRFFQRALHHLEPVIDDGDPATTSSPAGRSGHYLDLPGPHRELAARHFFVCTSDLEDELIRALGVRVVEQILDDHSDLRSFRTFQQQPAQQGKPAHAQLRRFMGTRGGRKIEYAPLLVQALDPARTPPPLARLLAAI